MTSLSLYKGHKSTNVAQIDDKNIQNYLIKEEEAT